MAVIINVAVSLEFAFMSPSSKGSPAEPIAGENTSPIASNRVATIANVIPEKLCDL